MNKVVYRTEVFSDGTRFVGLCPDFRIEAKGDTQSEAMCRLQEAVEAYLGQCKDQGILDAVLGESGFEDSDGAWKVRERSTEMQEAVLSSGQPVSVMSGSARE